MEESDAYSINELLEFVGVDNPVKLVNDEVKLFADDTIEITAKFKPSWFRLLKLSIATKNVKKVVIIITRRTPYGDENDEETSVSLHLNVTKNKFSVYICKCL